MGKFFVKFFLTILIGIFFLLTYLSYFGVETDKFDQLIKSKVNEVNRHVKLEFKRTKIHLNPKELNLAVKLQNPKILAKNNEILLSRFDMFLSLKSFFTSDFLLKRAEIAFSKNDIKDLTKITGIFIPGIINKRVGKIFSKGNLEGEFIIPFKPDGDIGKDYKFSGKISEAEINFTKEFSIKDLTTKISNNLDEDESSIKISIQKGNIYDVKLAGSLIVLKSNKNEIKTNSLLKTKGNLNFNQIRKVSSLLSLNFGEVKNIEAKIDLSTRVSFDLNKQFKIKDLTYLTEGKISHLELVTEDKKFIKKYLPLYDPKIILKDTKIKISKSKSDQLGEFDGLIKVKDHFDNFNIKEIYNYKDKALSINGEVDLTNSKVNILRLNYQKDAGKSSKIEFDTKFSSKKYYNINTLNFSAENTKIFLSNIKFNKNFEVNNFDKIKVITFSDTIKNNDFLIEKNKDTVISGEIFDLQPLLKTLYKKRDKKTFSNKFNSEIKINFDKALTGTNDDVYDIGMIASIIKGSYNKLSLKGNFSEKELVEMSIYQIDNEKKTLQVISDRARPFVKNFDFIEGFEGGKLEYESIISKDFTNSNLTITDFKVSKVPALAKLLTLASLQGIADTLSGEGIRFESFEMKSNSKENVLTIEDVLAIGPAISILMNGYVDKGNIVSLRGTLVPATKLNSIIASIPVVGDILVGKKTGEGVVGVSFKMKGPPKNIKTTVNPIKTLTPRFIVRAVEKMKKKEKKETK
tara:strand:+ start:6870 stop:9107 length:2238 start_codon:yes stop_codon:yes gene_type:complete